MKIRVSVATDFSKRYQFARIYNILPDGGDDFVEVDYKPPTPLWGDWFSLKVEFLNEMGAIIRPAILRRIGISITPTSPVETKETKGNKLGSE